MAKPYYESRDHFIPYEKVDRVGIRDSVVEIFFVNIGKPPVLRNEEAEAFLKGLRAYWDHKAGAKAVSKQTVGAAKD